MATYDGIEQPLYVVTGINRLTGEREMISAPHWRTQAEKMLRNTQEKLYRRHHQPYIKLRVEPYTPQKKIEFGE